MEAALLKMVTEAGVKQVTVKETAQDAHDLIMSQQGNPLLEMHVLREKYLTAMELALDAKSSKLSQTAVEGLQLLLRDNQLHSLDGTREENEQTLPMQVLRTLHCLPSWTHEPQIQCHCLTVVVQLMCSNQWGIPLEAVKVAVELCLSTYGGSNQTSVRQAARAAVTQILSLYCTNLYKEQVEDASGDDFKHTFEDVTWLLEFCTQTLAIG